ncbi:MAG: hypothetical protein ACKO40_10420 [Planctomycetaceae bacterium]
MTEITIKYKLADQCISPSTLTGRVFIPAGLGCCTLLVLRYALSWWVSSDNYSEPTYVKYLVVATLITATASVIYRSVLSMRISSKMHFLATYLKPDSHLRRLLCGQVWNIAVSTTLSIIFATLAYCVIQSYSWIDIAVLTLSAIAGLAASQVLGYVATDSLKDHVSTLLLARARRGITVFCVLSAAILLSLVHDTFTPLRHCDESEVVEILKKDIQHPVLTVQRVNRAMGYFNAQLIRARDHVSFPFGWIAYLFLLVPNTLCLYSLVCIILGYDFTGDSPARSLRSLAGSRRGPQSTGALAVLGIALVLLPNIGCGISENIEDVRRRAERVEKQIQASAQQAQAQADALLKQTQVRLEEAEARLKEVQEKLEVAESRARNVGRDINDLMKDDRARRSEEASRVEQQ